MPLDVRPDHLASVLAILKQYVPTREIWAFGSRVSGTATPTSDLDLCVRGKAPLPYETSARLRYAFSESNIPYPVDVVDWCVVSESFRRIIEEAHVLVQAAPSNSRTQEPGSLAG